MKIPVLISVPHGGIQVPEEVRASVQLSKFEIYEDIDPFAREIFNISDKVHAYVDTPIARTFVDANRAPSETADINPDGVVKSHTRNGLPIYTEALSEEVSEQLINRYHQPYHKLLQDALEDEDIRLAVDCHIMNPIGSIYSPDPGMRRPLICLSNMDGATSTMAQLDHLADCLARAFKIGRSSIGLNDPFKGGYILQNYGGEGIPWIQVEFNRCLFMEDLTFGQDGPKVSAGRLREMNWLWYRALSQFVKGSLKPSHTMDASYA